MNLEKEVLNIASGYERRLNRHQIHQAYVDGLLFRQSATFGDNFRWFPLEYRQVIEWAHLNARLRSRGYEGVNKYTWLDIVRSRKVPRKLEFQVLKEQGLLKPLDF